MLSCVTGDGEFAEGNSQDGQSSCDDQHQGSPQDPRVPDVPQGQGPADSFEYKVLSRKMVSRSEAQPFCRHAFVLPR